MRIAVSFVLAGVLLWAVPAAAVDRVVDDAPEVVRGQCRPHSRHDQCGRGGGRRRRDDRRVPGHLRVRNNVTEANLNSGVPPTDDWREVSKNTTRNNGQAGISLFDCSGAPAIHHNNASGNPDDGIF
jgi:parallel beta-helix repeat protein